MGYIRDVFFFGVMVEIFLEYILEIGLLINWWLMFYFLFIEEIFFNNFILFYYVILLNEVCN